MRYYCAYCESKPYEIFSKHYLTWNISVVYQLRSKAFQQQRFKSNLLTGLVPCTVHSTLYTVQCIVPYTVYNIVHKSLEWADSSFCLLCLFVQIYLIPQKIARCLVSVIINAVFSNWNRIKDGIQLPLFLKFLQIVHI